MAIRAAWLRVAGASLYYERRGAGPLLALVPAGAGDADSYRPLADILSSRYTVVTYDRRGYSRSAVDDPGQPIDIAAHRDDLQRLLAALAGGPAHVLGCSIGAIIGLDLAIHYPEQVNVLVAHEPPLLALVPAAERAELRREQQDVMALLQRDGAGPALQQLAANLGAVRAGEPDSAYAASNQQAFFKHDVGAVARYRLDLAALQASPARIVVAGGAGGHAYTPYRAAAALADRLGVPFWEFPGSHAGFVEHPPEFAAKLIEALEQA